jgi:hypothetical protein
MEVLLVLMTVIAKLQGQNITLTSEPLALSDHNY